MAGSKHVYHLRSLPAPSLPLPPHAIHSTTTPCRSSGLLCRSSGLLAGWARWRPGWLDEPLDRWVAPSSVEGAAR